MQFVKSKLPDFEMIYVQPSWKRSNENEIQKGMKERKESEKVKEIPPPPQLHSNPPSPSKYDSGAECANVMAFTLKAKQSKNKTYEGNNVNRTEKQNVDQNMASGYCNSSSLLKDKTGEIRKEREGKSEQMETKKKEQFEKKRLYTRAEKSSNNNVDEGWSKRSARLLHPLPYQPNSVQRYKCNNKK